MAYQADWQPRWTCVVTGRGDKPSKVHFGFLDDNEPVAQPTRGSDLGLPEMTIDEFNRQYKDMPAVLAVVKEALSRARNQRMKLPQVIRASELLPEAV